MAKKGKVFYILYYIKVNCLKNNFVNLLLAYKFKLRSTIKKIANEQSKEMPDLNLITYWEKEIKGLKKSLARAEKRLKRGH